MCSPCEIILIWHINKNPIQSREIEIHTFIVLLLLLLSSIPYKYSLELYLINKSVQSLTYLVTFYINN